MKTRIICAALLLVAIPVVVWAGINMDAYAELPSRNATLPSEQVTDARTADSLTYTTAIADRNQAAKSNVTVCVEADLSGAAGDTVAITFIPQHVSSTGTVTKLPGVQTVTATAGTGVDADAATQITAAGGRTFTFAEATPLGDTLTASTGSFITDGYLVGMTLAIASSSSNDGDYLIAAVTALVITIDTADDFAAEGPVSATMTVDATGDSICPAIFFEVPSGCTHYEIRHAAPSAAGTNVDITWIAYSVDPR